MVGCPSLCWHGGAHQLPRVSQTGEGKSSTHKGWRCPLLFQAVLMLPCSQGEFGGASPPSGVAPSLQAPAAHRTWSFPSENPWRNWVSSLQTSVSFSPRGANPLCRNSATRGLKSLGWGFKECTEQIGQLRSKVCEETPCGRVIRKLYCVLGLQLSMLTQIYLNH